MAVNIQPSLPGLGVSGRISSGGKRGAVNYENIIRGLKARIASLELEVNLIRIQVDNSETSVPK